MKPPESMTDIELREAIAVEIMGWTKRPITKENKEWWFDTNGKPSHIHSTEPSECLIPAYESSIEAAFEVVEKMIAKGYSFGCVATPMHSSVPSPSAEFSRSTYPPEICCGCFSSYGETIPIAISRAALQAVRKMEA